jgi:signal transduction histidine kinase
VPNIINDCIASCKSVTDQKVVTINFTDNDTNFPILLDKRLASLVVKNVLLNAVSFSKQGGVVLVERMLVQKGNEIGGRKVTEESVIVTIKDKGIGIPLEDQNKIFSKMFKARNVKDSDTTGSGLGLYIAKKVMDITGGSLWFISDVEEGSTFFIAFPTKGMKKKNGTTTLD